MTFLANVFLHFRLNLSAFFTSTDAHSFVVNWYKLMCVETASNMGESLMTISHVIPDWIVAKTSLSCSNYHGNLAVVWCHKRNGHILCSSHCGEFPAQIATEVDVVRIRTYIAGFLCLRLGFALELSDNIALSWLCTDVTMFTAYVPPVTGCLQRNSCACFQTHLRQYLMHTYR